MTKIPKLFEVMKNKNITAKELSKAIGVSSGNISDWKSGRSAPSLERLSDLANYLGVTTDFLLEISSEIESEHIQKYRCLDETGIRAVDELLDIEYERCTAPTSLAITSEQKSSKAAARRTSSDNSAKEPPSADILIEVTEGDGL